MAYTREQIEKMVNVPSSVEYELEEVIDAKLRKCGVFCRVFSRSKSSASLERKFVKPEYLAGKKVQDLLGVRIILYFEDDIEICKKYIKEWFRQVDDWEVYENDISEFRASKINGIFELEGDWVRRISNQTWELPIDQTFEIQIRTIFFEGWHEVEHDMRYKNKEAWYNYPVFSRKLNSVVATLELCDSSMVSICEDFAHQLYLDREWDTMIRMHYRIRMNDEPINEELEQILNENSKTLGKRLYRCKRSALIKKLLGEKRSDVPISVNRVIMLANEADSDMNSEEIRDVARRNNWFIPEKKHQSNQVFQYSINPLEEYPNFRNKLSIKANAEYKNEMFADLSLIIYTWTRDKYKALFNLPEGIVTECDEKIPGYWLEIKCDKENCEMTMQTYHLATTEAGTIWSVSASLTWDEERNVFWLDTRNAIRSTQHLTIEDRISNYNPPRFYTEILKNDDYQVCDVLEYTGQCSPVKDVEMMINLIKSNERQTPVILIASKLGEKIS